MARHPDSRLSPTALLALFAGIFSAACFFFFPGVAGMAAAVLGIIALSEIKRSEGRLHGEGVAIAVFHIEGAGMNLTGGIEAGDFGAVLSGGPGAVTVEGVTAGRFGQVNESEATLCIVATLIVLLHEEFAVTV